MTERQSTPGRSPRVIVAPDKFKGSLGAGDVARRVATGVRAARPGAVVEEFPVADGGDGTVDAVVAAGFARRRVRVTGPLGAPVQADFAVRGDTAVVELAEASGLRCLPPGTLDALRCGTRGTGEVIAAALDAGARRIVLGVGGSASTDGGTGLLAALGARFLDARGAELPPGGGALTRLARADLSGLDPRVAQTEFILAADVDNPLLGPHGAAAVYGPQKGASPADVALLEAGLARLAAVLGASAVAARPGAGAGAGVAGGAGLAAQAGAGAGAGGGAGFVAQAGAGAAGGTGFAALAVLGARLRGGIGYLLDLTGFTAALTGADLVITGEGALDAQTLHGKAPAGVATAARAAGVRVAAVCGRLLLDEPALATLGVERAYALTALEPDPALCIAEAGPLLERVAAQLAKDLLP
jgi:glycerate kinase